MPRPRNDSELLPAKDRMENAFWELLADREYRRITVTDIVHEAGVNRNSFYYHYSGLPELADSAIMHLMQQASPAIPGPDSDPGETWRTNMDEAMHDPAARQRIGRLALIAGPHSSPELVDSLRDFGRLTLADVLQVDPEHVDLKTELMLDFTVGGLLAVLRRWPELSDRIEPEDLLNEDLAMLAMGLCLSMSKADMLSSWRRIFRDDVADATGIAAAATAVIRQRKDTDA